MSWKDQNGDGGPWETNDTTDNNDKKKEKVDKPESAGVHRGENNPQNPWGARKAGSNSNNNANGIDDLIEKFQKRLKDISSGGTGGNGDNKRAGTLGLIALLVVSLGIWLSSGFYRVEEGSVGVVLRFGKKVDITGTGLRYHLPTPIETVIVRKVAVENRIDGGLKVDSNRNNNEGEQTLILTGDENMVHINYIILWKIKDISEYLFTARDPDSTIRIAGESSIREVIGQNIARHVLTEGREDIATKAMDLLQKILDQYKMGISIVNFQLQRVEPPSQVIDKFNDVQASLVDAERLNNEAEAYHNDIIPRARGEAEQIVQDAEAYKQQIIAQAEGEASRFNAVFTSYQLNREVTIKRYYLETMQTVLGRVRKTIIDAKSAPGIVPYFSLPQASPTASTHNDTAQGSKKND
jgi:membrane protease subunit HflK